MKKLLTLLSLTMAMTAFGTTTPQGNEEKSATMNITATVIKPLTIEKTQDMTFGNIIQEKEAKATGRYRITGEPNQGITITVTPLQALTGANDSLAIRLDSTLPTNIDESGDASFDIVGTITPSSTNLGYYSGSITAKVVYN